MTQPVTQPLQLGVLLDSVPRWIAPLLILLGIEFVLISHIRQSVNIIAVDDPQEKNFNDKIAIPTRDYNWIIGGMTFGILMSGIAVIQVFQISNLYAILLLFCGRMIEGVAAIRFYKKVLYLIRERRWGGDIRTKVRHKLTVLFIVVVGLYLMGYALIYGPFFRSLGYTIQFIWTVTALLVTSLGLRWKLRHVRDQFDREIILGVILFVTGAELFNFTFFGELAATLVGSLGYTVGFWFAAAFLIRDQNEPLVMELKYLIRDARVWLRS